MNELEIRFLGDFVVKVGGEPFAALNKPRLQSLLAYLILHRDAPQFRYHLAGMLWPDSSEAQALTGPRRRRSHRHGAGAEGLCRPSDPAQRVYCQRDGSRVIHHFQM